MCGITGYVSRKPIDIERAKLIMPKMVNTINHRGPDECGFHYDKYAALGMTRLKIIDMNDGSQPFYSKDKNICVIFNGEIYNFKILRKKLEKDGFQFNSDCDTEVIVYLYQKYGIKFVNHLNGMFAIAIWDSSQKQLLLVRDRLGIKPLYYTLENGNDVYFASETIALKASGVNLEIYPRAIDLYLAYRSVPAPYSIYKDLKKFMPG
jgi:asparagine synthase (glutamine-hydrolysing)